MAYTKRYTASYGDNDESPATTGFVREQVDPASIVTVFNRSGLVTLTGTTSQIVPDNSVVSYYNSAAGYRGTLFLNPNDYRTNSNVDIEIRAVLNYTTVNSPGVDPIIEIYPITGLSGGTITSTGSALASTTGTNPGANVIGATATDWVTFNSSSQIAPMFRWSGTSSVSDMVIQIMLQVRQATP